MEHTTRLSLLNGRAGNQLDFEALYNIQCTLYNTGCTIYNVYLVGEIQQRERAGKPQATFIPDLEKDKTEEGHIVGGGRREGLLGRGRGGGRREARGEVEASLRS